MIEIGEYVDEFGGGALVVQKAHRIAQHERRDEYEKENVQREQELVNLAVFFRSTFGQVTAAARSDASADSSCQGNVLFFLRYLHDRLLVAAQRARHRQMFFFSTMVATVHAGRYCELIMFGFDLFLGHLVVRIAAAYFAHSFRFTAQFVHFFMFILQI